MTKNQLFTLKAVPPCVSEYMQQQSQRRELANGCSSLQELGCSMVLILFEWYQIIPNMVRCKTHHVVRWFSHWTIIYKCFSHWTAMYTWFLHSPPHLPNSWNTLHEFPIQKSFAEDFPKVPRRSHRTRCGKPMTSPLRRPGCEAILQEGLQAGQGLWHKRYFETVDIFGILKWRP